MSKQITISRKDINNAFTDINSFSELSKKITQPIEDIVNKVANVIENDPLLNVSNYIDRINDEINILYNQIFNKGFLYKIPILGKYIEEKVYNIKSIQGKISHIFKGFDTAYKSLEKSIIIYNNFLEKLDSYINEVTKYQQYIENKLNKMKEIHKDRKYELLISSIELFVKNLNILIGNLTLTKERLLIKFDSTMKMLVIMRQSRPILKTLISAALLESAGQNALNASIIIMEKMGKTVENITTELTDKTIEVDNKINSFFNKPVMEYQVLINNIKKIKEHFTIIEQNKKELKRISMQENKKLIKMLNHLYDYIKSYNISKKHLYNNK